jgi:GAF domain-containing protein/ketosteroid isomerase-like protein
VRGLSPPATGAALCDRFQRAFNERSFAVWREVLDRDADFIVDGRTFGGVDAAVAYGEAAVARFPGLVVKESRILAELDDVVVTELLLVNSAAPEGAPGRERCTFAVATVRDGRIAQYRMHHTVGPGGRNEVVRVPAHDEAARIAEDRTALRRVARLVADGVSEEELFDLVNREVGGLVGADATSLLRFDPEDTITLVATWSRGGSTLRVGASRPVDDLMRSLRDAGRARRWGRGQLPVRGVLAEEARALGIRAAVAVPIVVDGRVWGLCFTASTAGEPFPEDAEARITGFMELVATAIANAQARGELRTLVAEQAARERIATLVAQDVAPGVLFAEVTAEVGRLLDADHAGMIRYLSAETIEPVAAWAAAGEHPDVGGEWPVAGNPLAVNLLATCKPTRQDGWEGVSGPIAQVIRDVLGVRSSVGSPIVVDEQVWGGIFLHSTRGIIGADVEARLAQFCSLVATAISNAQARADARRLAEVQAALRRVATLVARESPPREVLRAVAEEIARVLHVEDTRIVRYEPDDTAVVMADWGPLTDAIPIGSRYPIGGDNVSTMVARTGQPARKDYYDDANGSIGDRVRDAGIRSAVGAPIVVGGRLWGAVMAGMLSTERLPGDAEDRIAEFAELVGTAISNVEARRDLAASRARLVAAGDAERRRVVRDLHDGAQQRLVHTVLTLKRAKADPSVAGTRGEALVGEALEHVKRATEELRELARGIMPAVLTGGGLSAAVEALTSRSPVPTTLDVPDDRYPAHVEATAYFVIAEALTNVAKHAEASRASVRVFVADGVLHAEVRDDGRGGARPDGGGLDGGLRIDSPEGGGTVLVAEIPVARA